MNRHCTKRKKRYFTVKFTENLKYTVFLVLVYYQVYIINQSIMATLHHVNAILLILILLKFKQYCCFQQLDENALSLNVLSKSLLNTGQLKIGMLSPETLKTKCLRIAVFGGSITRGCGQMQYHSDAPGDDPTALEYGCNYANSFGAKLELELNQKYSCIDPSTGNKHIVTRIIQAGAPIDNLIENLIRYKIDSTGDIDSLVMREADLLFVESSVNDALDVFSDIDGVSLTNVPWGSSTLQNRWGEGQTDEEAVAKLETSLKGFYELAIGIVKSFPKKPDILFLGSSLNLNRLTLPTQTTIYVQQEVARYYNVPVISILDAFGSANHTDIMSSTMLNWFKNGGWMIGNGDCCHIRKQSHRILAKVILYALEVASTPGFMFGEEHQSPEKPLFVSTEKYNAYVNAIPFLLRTSNDARDQNYRVEDLHSAGSMASGPSPGWEFASEKGKWGLISTTPGAKITYRVLPEHTMNMRQNILHITALKSYEHMGVGRVSVYRCMSSDVGKDSSTSTITTSNNDDPPQVATVDIDFIWNNHNSQAHVAELNLGNVSFTGVCLQIVIENISSGERGHKIKLFSLTLI